VDLGDRGTVGAMASGGSVTLFEGAAFCASSPTGDIEAGTTQGLFVLDARLVSSLVVEINGCRPEPLAAEVLDPHRATFVARIGETLVIERFRAIGDGLHDEIVVRNTGEEATYVEVVVTAAADFANPIDVRDRTTRPAEVATKVDGDAIVAAQKRGPLGVRLSVTAVDRPPSLLEPGRVVHEAIVGSGTTWRLAVDVVALVDGAELEPHGEQLPSERLLRWRRGLPQLVTDHPGLQSVIARCADDLGALRVFDPEVPERAVVAGGVPWAMALHGRDALVTAWMALLVDPGLAIGVLETLARHQGQHQDDRTEEEPGRILRKLSFGGGPPSYGAVDTTPLFVMLLGELRRWGLAPELVERLLPHADAALDWLEHRAEAGVGVGAPALEGWIHYQRPTDRGRRHQSWRDTEGGLRSADGRLAAPPLATAEVQALWYGALVARSHFAREAGDAEGSAAWRARADEVRARFREDFWLEDRGYPALARTGEGVVVDALGSHLGWCLWTGILGPDEAASVAKHLTSPDLFSGWGVRTLAASTVGSSPLGYHHGAVWPHDTAIAAAGLMRYGFVDESLRLLGALLEAADAFGGRLPELFAGFDRADIDFPVAFPNACAPSAWASASVLLGLRTVLRFDPWVPAGVVHVAPVLLPGIDRLRVDDIPLLGGRLSVVVDGGDVHVEGVPAGIEVVTSPRRAVGGPESS
jgi:glycogen debranching enzyme